MTTDYNGNTYQQTTKNCKGNKKNSRQSMTASNIEIPCELNK